jgi:hypothetical protein
VINLHHLRTDDRAGGRRRLAVRVADHLFARAGDLGHGGGLKRAGRIFPVVGGAQRRYARGTRATSVRCVRFTSSVTPWRRWFCAKIPRRTMGSRGNGFGQPHCADQRAWTHRSGADPASHVAGIHVLRLRLLRDVPKGVASTIIDPYGGDSAGRDGARGCDGYWSDIGTPERYAQAEQDASAGRITSRQDSDLRSRMQSPSASIGA